ncbi:MAG: RecX family transcriptional regulator [Bacteroidota bacterium]
MAFGQRKLERPNPADLDLADGTITRIVRQKKDPDRASVFLDDAFAFGLAVDLVIDAGLRKGMPLSAMRQRELLVRQETFAAKAAALRYVSHRARTTDEVRRSLLQKGFAEPIVEDTVADLDRLGLLDDAAYARQYAASRFNGPGYGPARIRQDLIRRGVGRRDIDDALDALADTEDLGAEAREQAAKKWRSLASEADGRKRQKKTMDYLVRRGFGFDVARQAVEGLAEDEDGAEWDA